LPYLRDKIELGNFTVSKVHLALDCPLGFRCGKRNVTGKIGAGAGERDGEKEDGGEESHRGKNV
jgi:hypothetical protein